MTGEPRYVDATATQAGQVLPEGDILSCVVYTKPGMGSEVAAVVGALAGVEVHCGAEIDKLVITIEDVAGQPAAEMLGAPNHIEGVINTILIYHFGGQALASQSPDALAD
ncbi:chaperone NapD [Thiorhodococcus minor]|uniref:Chaperone NapD n=1 Tax=Thiorhodococcus minor TaxID=57489 RepID=A0A6M0K037_9GAMM|nr:chaperone NapD [Thiorhodococcus minor]NEV63102.1 chaperone NapD [Thiorhodococcus minor]